MAFMTFNVLTIQSRIICLNFFNYANQFVNYDLLNTINLT